MKRHYFINLDLLVVTMPNISLCTNQTCPIKSKCYRAIAKPNSMQSYTNFEPTIIQKNVTCEGFLVVKKVNL